MKSILYWECDKKTKSIESMEPIYYDGPFWAFWLIEAFDRIGNFGLDIRFKIEDRFTSPSNVEKKVHKSK